MMTEKEGEKDPSELIYDLPECFMMTWEELIGMTSTARLWYMEWRCYRNSNYPTSTNGGRHFKPQSNYPTSTNWGKHFKLQASYHAPTHGGRHFEPQPNNSTPTYKGRHFKPQLNDPIPTYGGGHFKPPHLETDNPNEALNKSTQQTPTEEDEVLKQL